MDGSHYTNLQCQAFVLDDTNTQTPNAMHVFWRMVLCQPPNARYLFWRMPLFHPSNDRHVFWWLPLCHPNARIVFWKMPLCQPTTGKCSAGCHYTTPMQGFYYGGCHCTPPPPMSDICWLMGEILPCTMYTLKMVNGNGCWYNISCAVFQCTRSYREYEFMTCK